jgi:hypothetical protein
MADTLSKDQERALLEFGRKVGVENIRKKNVSGRPVIIISVPREGDPIQTVKTFEAHFPTISFDVEIMESSVFQHGVLASKRRSGRIGMAR